MSWSRPTELAIPTVWYTFQAKDADDSDRLVSYRVEDLTEDRYDDTIQHFKDFFMDDEPMCENKQLSKDELSRRDLEAFWRWCFEQKITIVCYKEESSEIVAANLLHVNTAAEKDEDWPIESQKIKDLIKVNDYTTKQVDLFKTYNVDCYMAAYGLAVNSRYRGRGIATEMLKARVPICKSLGIKLTATNFTALGSQKAAEKAGFSDDLEVTYDDFAKMGPAYSLPGIKSKSLKLMSMRIE